MLGVKVTIMLPHDPRGIDGPSMTLPDAITVHEPRESAVDVAAIAAEQAAGSSAAPAQEPVMMQVNA